MLKVDSAIQDLYALSDVRKNFRVMFPNGERSDLTNKDIVDESVTMTESACTETVFRFGCVERSMIEFETVGVESIAGCRIQCGLEIDTTRLTSYQLLAIRNRIQLGYDDGTLVAAADSDLGYGYYRIPYGVYWVASCPRNKDARNHRRVTAYSADPTKYSEVERVRLSSYVPGNDYILVSNSMDLAAANLGNFTPGLNAAWGYNNPGYAGYTWAQIQALGAAESKTFSVTQDGHTYSVAISGNYAVMDYSSNLASYYAQLKFVNMSGWDSDEAWLWYQSKFAEAGVAEPAVAAHTRLPRTYLQPHLGYDQLDQYGPYDHAPIYWLPDEGCRFYIQYLRTAALKANTFVRLMWNLTCTYSVDGTVQETKTFFPLADLTATMNSYNHGGPFVGANYRQDASGSYTSNNVEQFCFSDGYDVIDTIASPLEYYAEEGRVDRFGVCQPIRLDGSSPFSIPAGSVEAIDWEDGEIEPIGMIEWRREISGVATYGTLSTGTGGRSAYQMLANYMLNRTIDIIQSLNTHFVPYLPLIVPFNAVIHKMPWLQPGDAVQIATGDPAVPSVTSFILHQTIRGVQDPVQEIGAGGGSVVYSPEAYEEGVPTINGGGSSGAAASGGGGQSGAAYVEEVGTTGIWNWRKWSDGLLELNGEYSGQPTTGSHYAVVNNFFAYYVAGIALPSDAAPVSNDYSVMCDWTIGNGFCLFGGTVGSKTTSSLNIYALATSGNQTSVKAALYIRAKWQ